MVICSTPHTKFSQFSFFVLLDSVKATDTICVQKERWWAPFSPTYINCGSQEGLSLYSFHIEATIKAYGTKYSVAGFKCQHYPF